MFENGKYLNIKLTGADCVSNLNVAYHKMHKLLS